MFPSSPWAKWRGALHAADHIFDRNALYPPRTIRGQPALGLFQPCGIYTRVGPIPANQNRYRSPGFFGGSAWLSVLAHVAAGSDAWSATRRALGRRRCRHVQPGHYVILADNQTRPRLLRALFRTDGCAAQGRGRTFQQRIVRLRDRFSIHGLNSNPAIQADRLHCRIAPTHPPRAHRPRESCEVRRKSACGSWLPVHRGHLA